VIVEISDERENNGFRSAQRGLAVGCEPVRAAPFGSPGSRRGDTAGPPSVTGASRARPQGANLGGTAEGPAFRPMVWDEGRFLFSARDFLERT